MSTAIQKFRELPWQGSATDSQYGGLSATNTSGQSGPTLPGFAAAALAAYLGKPDIEDDDAVYDGLFDPRRAPALTPPGQQDPDYVPLPINLDTLMFKAETYRNQANDALINNQTSDIYNSTKRRVNEFIAAERKKSEELQKRTDEYANRNTTSGIFGWISKILAPVAAVVGTVAAGVATVATGGAAAPLLGIAVLGLGGTALAQFGISVSDHVSKWVGDALTAVGVSKETAAKIADTVTGVFTLACPGLLILDPSGFGKLFRSVGEWMGLDKKTVKLLETIGNFVGGALAAALAIAATAGTGGLAVAGSVSSGLMAAGKAGQVLTYARFTQVGVGLVNGVTTMGSGVANGRLALARYDLDTTMIERNKLRVLTKIARESLSQAQQFMQQSMEKVADNFNANAKMVKDYTAFSLNKAEVQYADKMA